MNTPIVLAGKLRRPEVGGLARPRLELPLVTDRGPGLDLVIAPAGSGKTTLLAHVAARLTGPVAWYRMTSGDVTEHAFVMHLLRAFGQMCPGMTSSEGQGEGLGVDELLGRLDRAVVPECTLVMDDVQEIAGSPAERLLERFVQFRPRAIRLLLGSRRVPSINVPRLRVSGLLREIGADDLRFREWEVQELFAGPGERMSHETAVSLTRSTGGWAAALSLFHLATRGCTADRRAHLVGESAGRSQLMRSYLNRNVIDELPEPQRRFLMFTSALGVLTGELCDGLLETTGSAAILDDLEQRQLLTTSEDGRSFRYPEVLRSHLESTLVEECGVAAARGWYARSAALLRQAGHTRPAADPAPQIEVRLFGGFAISVAGRPVDFSALRPQSQRLLRSMMLSADCDIHRETLIAQLWPDADLATGTRRLQVAISSIRQMLERAGWPTGGSLVRHGDAYCLRLPSGARMDIRDFEAAATEAERATRRGDLAAAIVARRSILAVYSGELLPEDGPAETVTARREEFRLMAGSAATALAQDLAATGRPVEALVAARRAIQLDPYQDAPWQLTIELQEDRGNSGSAQRSRHEYRRMQDELGLPVR